MAHSLFKKITKQELKTILPVVNQQSNLSDFDPSSVVVMSQDLSFYPDYRLLEMTDKTIMPEKHLFAVYKSPEEFILLDYTNGPIYTLNKKCPISLDQYSALEYVRFFFNYTRGVHGRFIIAETLDDINWLDEPPLNARKAISKLLCPLSFIEQKGDKFILEASYIFLDSLVKSKIIIDQSGMIKIKDEEVLIEDMPVINEDIDA